MHHYTLVAPDLTLPPMLLNNAPLIYLDILPCHDRSLGRDRTLLIAKATRAKYTYLCSPPYFSSFAQFLFSLLSLSPSLSPFFCNKSRDKISSTTSSLSNDVTTHRNDAMQLLQQSQFVLLLYWTAFAYPALIHPSSHNTSLNSYLSPNFL